MIDMQLCTTIDQLLHGLGSKFPQPRSVSLDGFKEAGIPNAGHFDRLDVTGPFVTDWQGAQHFKIIDDGKRNGERANEILFAKSIDPVFYPDP